MTPFRQLAIKMSKSTYTNFGICGYLPRKESDYFIKYFMPTRKEITEYDHGWLLWMAERGDMFNNDLRILALLICEQHYLTYNNP